MSFLKSSAKHAANRSPQTEYIADSAFTRPLTSPLINITNRFAVGAFRMSIPNLGLFRTLLYFYSVTALRTENY